MFVEFVIGSVRFKGVLNLTPLTAPYLSCHFHHYEKKNVNFFNAPTLFI